MFFLGEFGVISTHECCQPWKCTALLLGSIYCQISVQPTGFVLVYWDNGVTANNTVPEDSTALMVCKQRQALWNVLVDAAR